MRLERPERSPRFDIGELLETTQRALNRPNIPSPDVGVYHVARADVGVNPYVKSGHPASKEDGSGVTRRPRSTRQWE